MTDNANTPERHEGINMMITIVRRGMADQVISAFRSIGVTYNMALVGVVGTGLDVADYLGLSEHESEIILSVVVDSKKDRAIALIDFKFAMAGNHNSKGVSAIVPITGVSGPLVLKYISGV
ncbi:MAG: hypothetical protein LBN34_01635 [Clostridiales Family XIII bacterium]|nr:hypothetical protein [Clostridiales Family XIII bacterium]